MDQKKPGSYSRGKWKAVASLPKAGWGAKKRLGGPDTLMESYEMPKKVCLTRTLHGAYICVYVLQHEIYLL